MPADDGVKPSAGAQVGGGRRLDSWKEIAAHFKREVRTVQRWETSEALPVHRHPHQQRSSVYAYTAELDQWWAGRRQVLAESSGDTRSSWQWVAGVVVLAAIAGGAWWRLGGPGDDGKLRTYPLTASPGVESSPSFSPDGTKVVYAWRKDGEKATDIYVKALGLGDPMQLTHTADLSETAPAWSPDGKWIAFVGSREGGLRLLVVPWSGGPERRIDNDMGDGLRPAGSFCWSPDSRSLIASFARAPDWLSSLYVVPVSGGEKRRLFEPPPGVTDVRPAVSADGRVLAFLRVHNYGMGRVIHTVALSPGLRLSSEPAPLKQAAGSIENLSFVGNERRLVYLAGCCASGVTVGLWTVRVDRNEAPRLLLPVSGVQGIQGSVSRDGTRFAYFSSQTGGTGFWRVNLGKRAGVESPAEEIPSSTAMNLNPSVAPDGQRIAYASSRSGPLEIWTTKVDGSQPVQVTNMEGAKNGSARWSPDGRKIVFNSSRGSNTDLYVVNSDGGEPVRLTSHPEAEHDPSWSADGKWIYFASTRTGRDEIWKIPSAGGPEKQVTRKGGFGGHESPDGKYFYYATAYSGGELRRVPVEGGVEESLVAQVRDVHDVRMARSGVYFLTPCAACDRLEQPHVLRRYVHGNGKVEEAGRFRLAVRMGFAVAPDESYVIVNGLRPSKDRHAINVTIVEGLR